MKTFFFIALQYLLPQHALSRLAGWLANNQTPWLKQWLIERFIQQYDVDMSIAADPDPNSYACFNDFFTRPLAEGQRPIVSDKQSIACPADGAISQLGDIKHGQIFQAKGHEYRLVDLLGGDPKIAEQFMGGSFATVYLSPKDYHRVHMPLAGTLESMIHVPGQLFSVNDTTAANVPNLFARNERVVALFKTDVGPMAVVLVGAMIVASIETTWAGLVAPMKKQVRAINYHETQDFQFEKGDEMGRFKLGSTAIVVFGKDVAKWSESLEAGSAVQMGQELGSLV